MTRLGLGDQNSRRSASNMSRARPSTARRARSGRTGEGVQRPAAGQHDGTPSTQPVTPRVRATLEANLDRGLVRSQN